MNVLLSPQLKFVANISQYLGVESSARDKLQCESMTDDDKLEIATKKLNSSDFIQTIKRKLPTALTVSQFFYSIGQCLNFNCAFVLVLMLRQTLTFLRTRGLGSILPLDQHIYLHKLTGWLIVSYGLLHTLMHLINFSKDIFFFFFFLFRTEIIKEILRRFHCGLRSGY